MEGGEYGGFEAGKANKTRKQEVGEALTTITEHHLMDDRGLEMLGEGGVRLVLTLEKFPNHVAKLDRELLMDNLQSETGTWSRGEFMATHRERHEVAEDKLKVERRSEQQLREYFGDMVLRERIGLMSVPVTAELVRAVGRLRGQVPDKIKGISEIETLVSLQDKAPSAAFGPESMGLQISYVESRIKSGIKYTRLNRCFIDCTEEYVTPEDVKELMSSYDEGLASLLTRAEHDHELHDLLKDVVTKAIKFSRETGRMLDFIGADNVRFYQDEITNKWKVAMLDVRIGDETFDDGCMVLARLFNDQPVDSNQLIKLLNTLNYTRLINALAFELAVPDRLAISRSKVSSLTTTILPIMRQLFKVVEAQRQNKSDEKEAAAK